MTSKHSILFILHLPPPLHGASMMGKIIKESKLINTSFDCTYVNLTTAKSLEDIGRGSCKKVWLFLKLLLKIRGEIKRTKPCIVYVTPNSCGGPFYKDYVVVQMLKRMGCRVVAHYHNKGTSERQERWFDDKLYRRFFKNLHIIQVAKGLYGDIEKYVDIKNVSVCHNGIPLQTKSEEHRLYKDKVTQLLFLSNLLINKGVFVLLDALRIIKERGYEFYCDFVGGETNEINLSRLKYEIDMRNLNDVVAYRGICCGDAKKKYFRKADIFVFPTLNETFGLVSLEAMEYKLPVVATREGGVPEVVEDGVTGLLCEKNDPEDLANKLIVLLTDVELCKQMGEAGYNRLKTHFTITVFEQRLKEILMSLL